jgi:hypothetical protein
MYLGIVEHEDKVAVLMDRKDFEILHALLGNQSGDDKSDTYLLAGMWEKTKGKVAKKAYRFANNDTTTARITNFSVKEG